MPEICETGIQGLDGLIRGGFPSGTTILLTGTPGTGKTILAMEFVYNGALKYREKSIYITFEEKKENLYRQARSFGWDFEGLEKAGSLVLASIPASAIEKSTVETLMKIIREEGAKRVVIDSLSTLAMNSPSHDSTVRTIEDISVKRFIYQFISALASMGATTLLISHNRAGDNLSIDGVSEFISDGIIHMKFQPMGGKYSRSLIIQKMRSVNNDDGTHPLEIGANGLIVHEL